MRHLLQTFFVLSAVLGLVTEEANARYGDDQEYYSTYGSRARSYSYGRAYCGNRIVFDCDHHMATMGSMTSPLDCGVATPRSHSGRVRGLHVASGSRWRCLRGQRTADIGLGAILVHAPCGGRSPKGQNQHFGGSGCLNVTAQMKDIIRNCAGTPYEIRYASKGRYEDNRVRYARHSRTRHSYAAYRPYRSYSRAAYYTPAQQPSYYEQTALLMSGAGY